MSNLPKKVFAKFLCFFIFTFCAASIPPEKAFAQSQNQNSSRIRVAQDFERRGDFSSALKIYRSLFELVPQNQLYYEGVKRNMIRLKLYDELIDLIRFRIGLRNDPRFHADLGNVYYKKGEQEQALQIWKLLLQRYPTNRSVYPYVASAMLANRLYDEAIEVYKQARENFRNEDLFVFELANIYVLRLNYKAATLEYLRYLEKNPQQFNYIEGRIASYTKEPEQARVVAEILKANLSSTKHEYLLRKQLADLYLRIEDYGNSLTEFKLLENIPNPLNNQNKAVGQEIYFFAEKALNAGEYDYAQQAFDLILTKYRNSPYRIRALLGVALAKQKQGRSAEAIESFRALIKAASRNPWAGEAQFQIAEIYFDDFFDLDRALASYYALLKKFPNGRNSVDAYFRIGDCFTAKGDLQTAITWYKKPLARNDVKNDIKDRSVYKIAYVDFLNGQFDEALEKLNKITTNLSNKQEAEQKYVNDALELSLLIESNKKASPEALSEYSRAQKLKFQRKTAEAIKTLQSVVANYPQAEILDETLLELGELEKIRGNFQAAIDYLQTLLENQSASVYNALAQKRIGEIYEEHLGDFQNAARAYELVLINYPHSLYLEEVRHRIRALQTRQLNN